MRHVHICYNPLNLSDQYLLHFLIPVSTTDNDKSMVMSIPRLLLWDCDDRTYSYYIEVSNDQRNWTTVVDKTKEACRSFEVVQFEAQPVTFIKLVGTHNTANEVYTP